MAFSIKAGDLLPSLAATLTDQDGTVENLTGSTVVFRWSLKGSRTYQSAAAAIVSAVDGTVRYDWVTGQTDAPGEYLGEFVVTDGASKDKTFPSTGYIAFTVSVPLE